MQKRKTVNGHKCQIHKHGETVVSSRFISKERQSMVISARFVSKERQSMVVT